MDYHGGKLLVVTSGGGITSNFCTCILLALFKMARKFFSRKTPGMEGQTKRRPHLHSFTHDSNIPLAEEACNMDDMSGLSICLFPKKLLPNYRK